MNNVFLYLLVSKFELYIDESFKIKNDGTWRVVTWRDMTWREVTWHGVTWRDMTWRDITWHDATWRYVTLRDVTRRNVTWRDMTWHDVTWCDMTWHEVTLHDMTQHDAMWRDATWRDMTLHDVTRRDTTWQDVTWRVMTWNNATWRDMAWHDVWSWSQRNKNELYRMWDAKKTIKTFLGLNLFTDIYTLCSCIDDECQKDKKKVEAHQNWVSKIILKFNWPASDPDLNAPRMNSTACKMAEILFKKTIKTFLGLKLFT